MKKEVYRYFIKRPNMFNEDVLEQAMNGKGFHTLESIEEAFNHALSNARITMYETEDTPQHFLYENAKKNYDTLKDSKIVKVKVTVEIEE